MSANEDYTTPQRTTEKSVPIIRKIYVTTVVLELTKYI